MSKPIVVIYLPESFSIAGTYLNAPMELMRALNGNFGNKESDGKIMYTDYWQEYYWFCFNRHDIDAPEFQVFYEKDMTEIQHEELKKMINNAIESYKQPQSVNETP